MILGLTGGIACGKSTVSNILKQHGAYVIDADNISKIISNNKIILAKLQQKFGSKIIKNNNLDRLKLKKIIFNSHEKREILNKIMHPVIIKKIVNEIETNRDKKLIILDIPLLYETNLEYLCNKILVVWSDKNIQIKRVMKRDNCSMKLAKNIINSQLSLETKVEKADYNIENSETLKDLNRKTEVFFDTLSI